MTMVQTAALVVAGLALLIALVMWIGARDRRRMEQFRTDFDGYHGPDTPPEKRARRGQHAAIREALELIAATRQAIHADHKARSEADETRRSQRAHLKELTVAFDQRRSRASLEKLADGVRRARESARRFGERVERIKAEQRALSDAPRIEGDRVVCRMEAPRGLEPGDVVYLREDGSFVGERERQSGASDVLYQAALAKHCEYVGAPDIYRPMQDQWVYDVAYRYYRLRSNPNVYVTEQDCRVALRHGAAALDELLDAAIARDERDASGPDSSLLHERTRWVRE